MSPVESDGEDRTLMSNDDAIRHVEEYSAFQQMTFQEAISRYDVVGAQHDPSVGSYVVLAERDTKMEKGVAIREMGYSSPSPWTAWTREERVSQLRDKQGIRTYYDMKRADGTVRGALRILKTPIQSAEWFIKPASDSTMDKNIAEFVEDNLFNRLNVSWSRFLEDVLTMCEYGYSPFETVYGMDPDGKLRLKKLSHRHPLDVREWLYDDNGGPDYLVMEPLEISGWNEIVIPIEKLVVFVFEQEGGDMRGTSILRSAYKHYYYKDTLYKIDAIQKERHGIGVPLIKMPMGFTEEDRRLADELGRNLRTNERAHITVPMNWEVSFAKLEGQPVDCMASIAHHDTKIMSNVLAPFLDDPSSKAESQDMFYKSTRYIGQTIADTINRHCIKQLVDFNFMRGGYPKLMIRRIGEWEDIRTMTFGVRNLVGAQLLTPDDVLEEWVRDQLFLPRMDKETQRLALTPQAPGQNTTQPDNVDPNSEDGEQKGKAGGGRTPGEPGKPGKNGEKGTPGKPGVKGSPGTPAVGPPRQQTRPPTGTPQRNAGTDRSGGK